MTDQQKESKTASLSVVATPIGNLGDISNRAIEILRQADLILAEDTRSARKLLNHFEILGKKIWAYHDHNEQKSAPEVIRYAREHQASVALISEAGTPLISDPGYRVVRLAHQSNIRVIPVPGPCAAVTLVSASGLATDRLFFVGFLPTKDGAQREQMEMWTKLDATVVFYESAHRLEKTLTRLADVMPHAEVAVGRELTKVYEQVKLMTLDQARQWWREDAKQKGELVVAVKASAKCKDSPLNPENLGGPNVEEIALKLRQGQHPKELLRLYTKQGGKRTEIYNKILEAKALIKEG